VKLAHLLGEVGVVRLHDEAIRVVHLAIGVAAPVATTAHLAEHGKPIRAILAIA
jgi:hypothetical protein